ncbi:hypothetical protein GW17_00044281 [Ensete ventricosum]|nr:hypothetical protein GW17_00044281 [Ensete ventricosum]
MLVPRRSRSLGCERCRRAPQPVKPLHERLMALRKVLAVTYWKPGALGARNMSKDKSQSDYGESHPSKFCGVLATNWCGFRAMIVVDEGYFVADLGMVFGYSLVGFWGCDDKG